MARLQFPAGAEKGFFCLHYPVQTGSRAFPAFYPVDTRVKVTGV